MSSVFSLVLAVCLGLCAARALPDDESIRQIHSPPAVWRQLFHDTAAELSRATASSNNTVNHISLPLKPSDHDRDILDGVPTYPAGSPMEGGQLVYALHFQAYDLWRNERDVAMRKVQTTTFPPFNTIQLRLSPMSDPSLVITPQLMGVEVLRMTYDPLVNGPTWPGALQLDMFIGTERKSLGNIRVQNSFPDALRNPSSLARNDTLQKVSREGRKGLIVDLGRTHQSTVPVPIPAKAWLRCFSEIIWYVFSNNAAEAVRNSGVREGWNYPGVRCTLLIYHAAPRDLVWADVATMLMLILYDWAVADVWQSLEKGKLIVDGRQVGQISIMPRVGSGVDMGVLTA